MRNAVLRDQRLSFKALGVLVEILSRPDNWQTRSETLAAGRAEGRDAVRSALAELKAAGYLEQHKIRGERGRMRTVSVVYDEPLWWTKAQVAPETGCPAPVGPEAGEPGVGEPVPLRTSEKNIRKELGSEVEWPSKAGRAHEDPNLPTMGDDPDNDPAGFTDWRCGDRDLFRSIVGNGLATDGSTWKPEGTFTADVWYDALRKTPKPIQWPGRYLSQLLDNDGLDNWLLAKGLELAQ